MMEPGRKSEKHLLHCRCIPYFTLNEPLFATGETPGGPYSCSPVLIRIVVGSVVARACPGISARNASGETFYQEERRCFVLNVALDARRKIHFATVAGTI